VRGTEWVDGVCSCQSCCDDSAAVRAECGCILDGERLLRATIEACAPVEVAGTGFAKGLTPALADSCW